MPENLLRKSWAHLDQSDLRLLLHARISSPNRGQYDGAEDVLYLPLAREHCRISLKFQGDKIVAITPRAAFDRDEWDRICGEIETSLLVGPQRIGREFSFSTHRVERSWRGERSGVQILPPPDGAPRASEMADDPFILEFPIQEAGLWDVTNHRRRREHRRLTLLLNLLLAGTTKFQPDRRRHFWAAVPSDGKLQITWVQEFFFADLGEIVIDKLSPPIGGKVEELESEKYYREAGHDGRGLRVPDELDDLIYRYQRLLPADREKLDRATYWMSMARRQWEDSMSASFTSLVSAVEALTEIGIKHNVYCSECGQDRSHDVPGATERFRAFFEQYAPDPGLRARRSKMYAMRSKILHGSDLMQLDQDRHFGCDPPGWGEFELNSELWALTRVAARNWLRAQIIVVDRVSPLNAAGAAAEVHSVGIGNDPYVYALGLVERDRKESRPPRRYLIEQRGHRSIYSAEEVVARVSM
jgi:Apea-like HEPN